MNDSIHDVYFRDGGTLPPNTPSYVKRPADDELLEAVLKGEYCYILTPRQMGKSSLMTSTSQRLKMQNIQTAIIDIQGIGTNKQKEFYTSLLSRIRRGLRLSVDIDEWMNKKANMGFGNVFSDFIQDVVLVDVKDPIVIFLDEVDWMIKIDFRDEFFASIRSMYNARAEYPEFNRISFVLLGVASPADLISEPTRTPFNIGHAIPLQELSLSDAGPLQTGLDLVCPGQGKRILTRIFYWTNGHPYLTQKVCKTIAESEVTNWSDIEIDNLVNRLFIAEESRKEANLKFIQDRILSNEHLIVILKLYSALRRGKKIKENGQSIVQNQLMLSGLLTARGGYLLIRNRIYQTVFNDLWISRNMPRNWQRTALSILGTIIITFLGVFLYDAMIGMNLNSSSANFYKSETPKEKLHYLANIYRLKGVISKYDTSLSATQLFYGLSRQNQLSLFNPEYLNYKDPNIQDDLVTVIENLSVTIAYVDPENDNTDLLQSISIILGLISDNPESIDLKNEFDAWLKARNAYLSKDYDAALENYDEAVNQAPKNPAITFERALVHVELGSFQNALLDLNTTIGLAKETTQQDEIDLTPTVTATENISYKNTLTVALTKIAVPTVSINTSEYSNTQFPTQTSPPIRYLDTPTASVRHLDTPTAIVMYSDTPTVTVIPEYQSIDQFESNFSTFIEIVNAVQNLIESTTGLQSAMQQNVGSDIYANLKSVGLVKNYPTPIPSATPTFTPVPPTSTSISIRLSITDGFENNNNEWTVGPKTTELGTYESSIDSEYDVFVVNITDVNKGFSQPILAKAIPSQTDYAVGVRVLIANPGICAGVMFRITTNGYYVFEICEDQTYTVAHYDLNNQEWTSLIKKTSSSVIKKDEGNYLIVAVIDNVFAFSINGEDVGTAKDSSESEGLSGLFFETTGPGIVVFDDFTLVAQ